MIKFTKIVSAFALGIALLFTGCSNLVEENTEQSSEYGTLIYGEDIRAINVDSVKTAKVFVTGNGITSPLTSGATKVEKGRGSVTIEKIPVGKNRIVTVRGYSDPNATAEVVDAVLRAVIDINPGVNTLPLIDWDVSRKGYVYNALFENGVNISTLSSEEMAAVDAATPSCDATNINLPLFVEDFKKGYDKLQASSAYILSVEKTLKRLTVEKSASSTESAPAFTATAYYSDGTNEDVTSSATWNSTETAVATVSGGKVTLVAAGKTVISASHTFGGVTKTAAKQTVTVTSQGGTIDKVYLVPNSNWTQSNATFEAYMWNGSVNNFVVMTKDGDKYVADCDRSKYTNIIFLRCNPSGTANSWSNEWNRVAQQTIPTDKDTFTIDDGQWGGKGEGSVGATGKWELKGSYSGGTLSATVDSETITAPVPPTVTISPAGGNISLSGSIKVTFTDGNDTISSAKVTINGTSYDMGTTAGTFSKSVKDLGITTGGTPITVSATVTNGEGTATKSATLTTADIPIVPDTFTWDNVNCYFVLTDRFKNGDTKNDHSYYRQNADNNDTLKSGYNNVATFHGGDIVGLTQELDYLNGLGVNAIWITAPYEQAHGWCTGGGKGFPHYAFHGYYTQDWTYMDQNMGTIEEFRTFVNEAHKRGIRIVMDVVMNHTGYNTVEDMITYDFGNFNTTPEHGWISSSSNWEENHSITNYDEQGKWGNWWGCWVRAFNDKSWYSSAGYAPAGSGDITGSLTGLPDVVTERASYVSIPTFLKTKWTNETDSETVPSETGNTTGNKYGDYKLTSITNADWNGKSGDWRADNKGAPADYQVMWLSGWVREFGIDGFRCDTAKHIDMYRWGQLKQACQSALEAWRNDSSKEDTAGAKLWDESFWMTGECFGWNSISGNGDYYTTGGFDSMIGFGIGGSNHWENSGYNYYTPSISENTWSSYLSINNNSDSDDNGNRNNVLTYISSHDTRLSRWSNQAELGTMFVLLPGGVQIYYGDETSREKAYTDCGDGDMATRGDFNWSAATGETAKHWGKVGTFRKFNPAVGAGTGSATKRTYSGPAGESKVAIGISGSSVDVKDLFTDGTTVYNWYDGASATVSGGKVVFTGGTTSQPILVSDKNPADYGVTF